MRTAAKRKFHKGVLLVITTAVGRNPAGKLDEAELHFGEALRLNPGDAFAQNNLELVSRTKRGGGAK